MIDVVRERGRLTVAAFMDLALYDPTFGYYARAPRRSGRSGDFFTSVDVGPLFGELLGIQIGEMGMLLRSVSPEAGFDIVEAGASDGRLAADVMQSLANHYPDIHAIAQLHLVEASASARSSHDALRTVTGRLASSSPQLPATCEGVLYANELLDAFPVHQVVMRDEGLREVFVAAGHTLVAFEDAPSTPALAAYLDSLGITLPAGARAEINLQAVEWIRTAARALRRGFLILIDYGHEAHELYSATHATGTLTSFTGHVATGPGTNMPAWLANPGEQDLTAHVDFTTLRRAAEAEGFVTLGLMDQTYFLMGLAGFGSPSNASNPLNLSNPSTRRAFSTLTMPGGLGSTMKVLILGKNVGTPSLLGCSCGTRMT